MPRERFRVVPAAYVFLLSEGRVLLQLRDGTGYLDGHWAAGAAGHVEDGESVFAAARREAREELGIDLVDLEPLTTMHRTQLNGRSVDERIDIFFTCREWRGTPCLVEQKAVDLGWFDLTDLPTPLVPHEQVVLDHLRAGTVPPLLAIGFPDVNPQGRPDHPQGVSRLTPAAGPRRSLGTDSLQR